MTSTIAERLQADMEAVRARIRAETARLDREDEITAEMDRTRLANLAAHERETRRSRIATAVSAARRVREGDEAGWDYRAVLAEYGVDEYGQPLSEHEAELPRPR